MWVCGCVWMCIKNLCLLQGKMATIQHAPNKAKASCLCGPTFFAEQQIPQAMVKTPIIKKKGKSGKIYMPRRFWTCIASSLTGLGEPYMLCCPVGPLFLAPLPTAVPVL